MTGAAAAAVEGAQCLTEGLFDEAVQHLLSDRKAYRTTTVLYLLQAFYAEAVLRESSPEVKIYDWTHVTKGQKSDHYFLNMDVFGTYISGKLIEKLNAYRGAPGMHGLDIACGTAGRPGKVKGCPEEHRRLLKAFKDAQDFFVKKYLRVDHERDARLRGGGLYGIESADDEKISSRPASRPPAFKVGNSQFGKGFGKGA